MKRFVVVLTVWMMGLAGVLASVLSPAASASAAVPVAVPVAAVPGAAVSTPGGFTSVAPFRLLDTRSGLGVPTTTPVAAGGTVALQVLARGGVPASGVSAVVLNVTVAEPTGSGFVTVYGDGTTRPTASNLNYVKGRAVPNLVIAPVGANGKVALFNGSPGTVHLVADVSGYFVSGDPTVPGAFVSLAPSRLLDTRSGLGAPTGAVAAGGTVALQVLNRGGVPASGVSAVVLNVTVAEPTSSGFVTAYGDGTTRPTASNLNYVKAQVVPNLVIAPVGANGKVALFNGSPGTTQLIADVSGYFLSGTPAVVGALGSVAPFRLLDTRSGLGAAPVAVAAGGTLHLQVTDRGGVPASGVSAVVLNVTVTAPTTSGFLTVFGDGTTRPTASNLNFVKAQTVPNPVVAPVGADGKVAVYNGSGGSVQLIADVSGWFVGPAQTWVSMAAPSIGYTPGVNRFAATLVPAVTGRTVSLQRYSQGSWVNVGSAVEDPHGVVEWNPRLTGTGDAQFRAYTPATPSLEAAASASATVSLTPTPPPAPKVSIQIAPSVTIGSTIQLDLQGALDPVTTAVVQPGGLPAGVTLTIVNGTLLLEAEAGATVGSSVVLASGTGCVVNTCGTPYDLEIDLTIAPLSNVSGGIDGFTNPSSDRIASAGQLPGGSATALPDELLAGVSWLLDRERAQLAMA